MSEVNSPDDCEEDPWKQVLRPYRTLEEWLGDELHKRAPADPRPSARVISYSMGFNVTAVVSYATVDHVLFRKEVDLQMTNQELDSAAAWKAILAPKLPEWSSLARQETPTAQRLATLRQLQIAALGLANVC